MVLRHQVLRFLERRGASPAQGPNKDARQKYQAQLMQQRLR